MSLQDLQAPIDNEIVRELIDLAPTGWSSIALKVGYANWGNVERYSHEIYSLDGLSGPVEPSEFLMQKTYEIGELFSQNGTRWKSVVYEVRYKDGVGWEFEANFYYI